MHPHSYVLMTEHETGEYLRRRPNWLAKQRITGLGPKYVKLGGRVFYRREDVEAWLESLVRSSTSEKPAA